VRGEQMNLTKYDKIIIKIGIVIILLFGLFPPWAHFYPQTGYFIESYGNSIFYEPPQQDARIHFPHLIYNWTITILITAAIIIIKKFLCNRKVQDEKN
jgi:hypothetical protein